MKNFIGAGDVAITVSGGEDSPNVLNGMRATRVKEATTIGITGFYGEKLKDLFDVVTIASSYSLEQIEDIHLLVEHVTITYLRKET